MRLAIYGVPIPEAIIEKFRVKLEKRAEFTFQYALEVLKLYTLPEGPNGYPTKDVIYYNAATRILKRFQRWGWIKCIDKSHTWRWV